MVFDFYIEGTTTPASLLIGTVITDVDWGQGSNFEFMVHLVVEWLLIQVALV